MVKFDVKAIEVSRPFGGITCHQGLWRDAFRLSFEHNGRAVGVVSANKMYGVPSHSHAAHPNIGLDVLHDVANVEVAIGIGQCGRDEKAALCNGYGA